MNENVPSDEVQSNAPKDSSTEANELSRKGLDRRNLAKAAGLVAVAAAMGASTASAAEVKSNIMEKLKTEVSKSKANPLDGYIKHGGTYAKNPPPPTG